MHYPATFTPDTGGFVVTFRDIPEAITQGDTHAEALEMAEDVLISALEFYFEGHRAVPPPSAPEPGEIPVRLPASVAAKILLLNAQLAQGISNTELARRMDLPKQAIQRVTDLRHATKIDTIDRALQALGGHLELSFAQAR